MTLVGLFNFQTFSNKLNIGLVIVHYDTLPSDTL